MNTERAITREKQEQMFVYEFNSVPNYQCVEILQLQLITKYSSTIIIIRIKVMNYNSKLTLPSYFTIGAAFTDLLSLFFTLHNLL